MNQKRELYNLSAARTEAQLAEMEDLTERGICIFCNEYIHLDKEELIIDSDHWMVKNNTFPYEGVSLHLVIIPKAHVATISELSEESKATFLQTVSEIEAKFNLNSYAIGMRSGDMHYNGGSVEHLHAHLIVGDYSEADHNPVRFKMSSRP